MEKKTPFEEIIADVKKTAKLINGHGWKRKPEYKVPLTTPLNKLSREDWRQMNLQSISNWKARNGL